MEAASIVGMTQVTMAAYVNSGVVEGVAFGHSRKARFAIPAFEVFTVIVARQLHQHGFTLPIITHVTNWLRSQSLSGLEKQWEAGRNLLLAVGDCEPFPFLLSYEQVYRNPCIDLPAANAAGVATLVIDIQQAYRQLSEAIAALRESRKNARDVRDAKPPKAR
jgi:hypothetical protein